MTNSPSECLGAEGGLQTLVITRNDHAVTLFLAGDSTVTEQHSEPYAGWGQMLPLFFQAGTAIANHAESGLALNSFRSQRRLEKILQTIKPGDYVFIQFGHNDQKEKTPGSGPFTTYKERLKEYIRDIRGKKGNPVVVTPMERRRFNDDKPYTTLQEFAEAARQVAQEEQVPLIDLHTMSLQVYEALGVEASRKAFVHYPAGTFPGQDKKLEDDTHHNAYGGLQLAKCIVEGIRQNVPELTARLRPETPKFDPHHPDNPDDLQDPGQPGAGNRPAGRELKLARCLLLRGLQIRLPAVNVPPIQPAAAGLPVSHSPHAVPSPHDPRRRSPVHDGPEPHAAG